MDSDPLEVTLRVNLVQDLEGPFVDVLPEDESHRPGWVAIAVLSLRIRAHADGHAELLESMVDDL